MRSKLCLYIMLLLFSPLAQAEYYLVYGMPACCENRYVAREYPKRHHHYRHQRHRQPVAHHYHRRSSYRIEEYYVYNPPCGGCGGCGYNYGCGQVVYTTRPSSCVTYDEVVNGTQYSYPSYYDNDP